MKTLLKYIEVRNNFSLEDLVDLLINIGDIST
jgi:hypothetical protein